MLKLWFKARSRREPRGLREIFDEAWYVSNYPAASRTGLTPLDHYRREGAALGFSPSPLFDAQWYAEQDEEARSGGLSPLEHYVTIGAAKGFDPCPLFDTSWYLEQNPDVMAAGVNPLAHYLQSGMLEGRDPCPYFSTLWYRYRYADVRKSGIDPLLHYLTVGAQEGRNPSPDFDTQWYRETYLEGQQSAGNPLAHFLRIGRPKRFKPAPDRHLAPGYEGWMQTYEALNEGGLNILRTSVAALRWLPLFSIVVPTYNTSEEVLTAFLDSVLAQVYPHWELCIADDASSKGHVATILNRYAKQDARIRLSFRTTNGHIAAATNTALAMAKGDYICLMDHDDEIAPDALYEFAIRLNADPELDFIYSDEDKLTEAGHRYEPFFKPDWSPEALEACMYTAHFACYRTSLVRIVGGFRSEFNGAQDYDFILRFTEKARKIAHVPKILYHWRAVAGSTAASMDNKDYVIDAAVRALEERVHRIGELEWVKPNRYGGCFDVRRKIVGEPKISIVIPTAGRDGMVRDEMVDMLVHCISSVANQSTYRNYEIIAVHNGDLRESTLSALAPYGVRLVHYQNPVFNVATKMNLGAAHASGEYVLFLNDDTEVISADWLEAMLSVAQTPEVGAVGARLYFDDGKLQHVGVAFWNGLPDHIRRGFGGDDPGHFFSTVGLRNYLAVTGACVLSRTRHFEGVGGFDEAFPINYNDIDYCLKLHKKGLRIVYAPQAELFHFESKSRDRTVDDDEITLFQKRWAHYVAHDPYYSDYFDPHPPNFILRNKNPHSA